MQTDFRDELGSLLPDNLPYPYFAEREGAWLLRCRLGGPARIARLREGPLGGYLTRLGMREVTAVAGDGWLRPNSLLPLADPLEAFGREHEFTRDRTAEAAFDVACVVPWTDYTVSFAQWPVGLRDDWRQMQMSRKGWNLVMQLNLPSSYVGRFNSLFPPGTRECMEYYHHPVQSGGQITLVWARLDFDRDGEDLLIEEIQSDWLRRVSACLREDLLWYRRRLTGPEREFFRETLDVHGRTWARAMMLAVLVFASRELGVRRVWMHRPETGAKLKRLEVELPPRSIYMDLPRRFGFQPTGQAPDFLYKARSKVLAKLRRAGNPLFWQLNMTPEPSV